VTVGSLLLKRRSILAFALFTVLLLVIGVGVWWGVARVWSSPPRAAAGAGTVVAAVGDMACSPAASAKVEAAAETEDGPALCKQVAVSDAMLAIRPSTLLALGDEQYENGAPDGWGPYERSYGRLRDITRPVPGNHEYLTPGGRGYYDYFGDRAGDRARGYYSFDVGGWHVVALNSQCKEVGGCAADSPQLTWLNSDLAQNRSTCTLAYWHIPRFSSGEHGDHTPYRAIWQALADHGTDLALAGHDHDYERFAPLDADGRLDQRAGIRSFVVGTGGRNLRPVTKPRAHSERVIDNSFGFLELHLRSGDYSWQFKNENGKVRDEGEGKCH
jgi:hypothetical protein